ncbi:MAG: family 10 glycosylhydrolase [Bacilli bacterium]|nr:family 10 glycosylhydrolase [Bacilli bacterium]
MSHTFQLTLPVDGINSIRGTDQVIIFTFDKRTQDNGTGTNVYGYELLIDANKRVVAKGTHVFFIENSYIISAHGKMAKLLEEQIEIGDKVDYSSESKVIVFTREITDILYRMEVELDKINSKVKFYQDGLYDIDFAGTNLLLTKLDKIVTNIKELVKTGQEASQDLLKEYEELVVQINSILAPSFTLEERGFWHRPNIFNSENDLAGLEEFLTTMKNCGFNAIYVETFWWGRSISDSAIVGYHPRVNKGNYGLYNDYLSALIDISHKLGMEVHAWTETFFVGGELAEEVPVWLTGKEDWICTTFNGSLVQTGKGTEEGFIFLDPCNEAVHDFLINYYQELAKYPLDGIQLDYIRYPHEDSLETSSGYTDVAMQKFKEECNIPEFVDLRDLLKSNDNLYQKWREFRQKQVTNFVIKVTKAIKQVNPNLKISIAVGPDPENAKRHLMQDWTTWVKAGVIDIICPMAYSRDINYVKDIVSKMKRISNGQTFNYPGIGTFMGFPEIENVDQILACREEESLGVVLFASQYIYRQDKMLNILRNCIFRKLAISPTAPIEQLVTVMLDDIETKMENIYLKQQLLRDEESDFLLVRLNEIKRESKLPVIISLLTNLINELHLINNEVVRKRLCEDLEYLLMVLGIRLNYEVRKHE